MVAQGGGAGAEVLWLGGKACKFALVSTEVMTLFPFCFDGFDDMCWRIDEWAGSEDRSNTVRVREPCHLSKF